MVLIGRDWRIAEEGSLPAGYSYPALSFAMSSEPIDSLSGVRVGDYNASYSQHETERTMLAAPDNADEPSASGKQGESAPFWSRVGQQFSESFRDGACG
jgi:hypothetical protein